MVGFAHVGQKIIRQYFESICHRAIFGQTRDIHECGLLRHNGSRVVNRRYKEVYHRLVFFQIEQAHGDDFLVGENAEGTKHDEEGDGISHIGNVDHNVLKTIFTRGFLDF